MACGCAVAGYSGLGGRELIALGSKYGVSLEVAFGDWQGFLDALCALDRSFRKTPLKLQQALLSCSQEIRRRYATEMFQASVEAGLSRWEGRWRDLIAETS